jgi:hypothetical protein
MASIWLTTVSETKGWKFHVSHRPESELFNKEPLAAFLVPYIDTDKIQTEKATLPVSDALVLKGML